MRRSLFVFTCFGLLLGATQVRAQWWDDFDTYETTTGFSNYLCVQSDWDEWDGSTNVDCKVSKDYGLTVGDATHGNTAMITGQTGGLGNDCVYDFSYMGGQPNKGYWITSADLYIPSDANGAGMYIMLNSYPNNKSWSVQIDFQASNGIVHSNQPAGGTDIPIIFDEWVSVITCIDLANNVVDFYYGEDLVVSGVWGASNIACIDLYGREPADPGIKYMYWDNFRMERVAGRGLALTAAPNPAPAGQKLTVDLECPPSFANGMSVFFIWSINGAPFRSQLFPFPLDSNGEASFGGTVPAGLSGLEVGLKAFAIPSGGGKLGESNHDLVVFQ